MAKTISAAMKAHLAEDITTLAAAWLVTRTDGVKIRTTLGFADATIDDETGDGPQLYASPDEGFKRHRIQNDAELNVGNTEILGIFNTLFFDETELRRGLFDHAEGRLFFYNYEDLTMGIIKILRAQFAKVITTDKGFFRTELRDLTALFGQGIGEVYSKDDRADLGDARNRLPIFPLTAQRNTAYQVGDYVRVDPALDGLVDPVLLLHGNTDFDSAEGTPVVSTSGSIDTAIKKFGAGSMLFTPGQEARYGINSGFDGLPKYEIGTKAFTIEGFVRFTSLTEARQAMASHYSVVGGDNRGWYLARDGSNLRFVYSLTGATEFVIAGSFTWAIDTWYHVVVQRKTNGDVQLGVDGTQVGTTTAAGGDLFNPPKYVRLALIEGISSDFPFSGRIDEFRWVIGGAIYPMPYTVPTVEFSLFDDLVPSGLSEDYANRIYKTTTAGTSDAQQPVYDTIVGNTTTDGTAVLTAEEAWSRFGVVSALGTNVRRDFSATQFTPNTGGPRGGFPDDWHNFGVVTFESGLNIGRSFEVRDFIADDGVTIVQDFELDRDTPFDIAIGDKFRVYPGYDHTFAQAVSKFGNSKPFAGEPFAPSSPLAGTFA